MGAVPCLSKQSPQKAWRGGHALPDLETNVFAESDNELRPPFGFTCNTSYD